MNPPENYDDENGEIDMIQSLRYIPANERPEKITELMDLLFQRLKKRTFKEYKEEHEKA